MRKFSIILLAFIFICSCAAQKTITKEEPNLPAAISAAPVQPPDKPVLPEKKDIKSMFGKLLKNVTTSMSSINPSHKEKVTLSYLLSRPAKTTINVYDPDLGLIKTFSGKTPVGPGKQTLVWDGTDMDGNIVPNEAYFPVFCGPDVFNGDSCLSCPCFSRRRAFTFFHVGRV